MNILIITHRRNGGGAALAASVLLESLPAHGHPTAMLTGLREAPAPHVDALPLLPRGRLGYHAFNLLGLNYFGITGARRLFNHPFVRAADVIHLHNIHGGFFNPLWVRRLARSKPLVWTLHDMWPLTGHCSHSFDCLRWVTGCGQCPYPSIYPPLRRDATRLEWRIKRNLYRPSEMTLISPSRWLASIIHRSIMGHLPLHVLPNAIDITLFAPRPMTECRRRLQLDADRFVLLFVAEKINNPFKHFDFLPAVLDTLPADFRRRLVMLIMGERSHRKNQLHNVDVRELGPVNDPEKKADIFGAATLLLYPTRADTFPMTIQEAIACGCPVVAEDVGGVNELVRPGQSGLLAPPNDARAFAEGIMHLCNNPPLREHLSQRCRLIASREFTIATHTERLIAVYKETHERFHGCHPFVGAKMTP
jgi:glycosyltransferase involved in cell wall biosynthesis